MFRKMKIAILSADDRELYKRYTSDSPIIPVPQEALLEGFLTIPDIEIHFISCFQRRVSSPKRLNANTFFHSLHVPSLGWMKSGFAGCILSIRNTLKKILPDIVHGQGTERECGIAAVFSGFPNVITIHGNMRGIAAFYKSPPGSYYWLASILETVALKKTKRVFCNSVYTEGLVHQSTTRSSLVPNPIRKIFFRPCVDRPRNLRPIFLNIGLISPHKQQVEILKMAKSLSASGLRFSLKFIGRCPDSLYAKQFLSLIAESSHFAEYLGVKSGEDLVGEMDSANAFLHFPKEEAFGLVVAESLARNLKLFGARVGGVVDIASSQQGVELYDSDDWAGLKNGIMRWIKAGFPPAHATDAIMRSRYYPDVIANRHLEIYREVLSASKTS
jgi:glycosyltransferase involved in cell wall biosynthesis